MDSSPDTSTTPVRAVVFDHFGTLTPATAGRVWWANAALSAEPLGIPVERWKAALDGSFPERATGRLGSLPETFRTLAQRCGVDPDERQLAGACAARRSTQLALFRLRSEVEPTLMALRDQGVRLGVLSDCTVELADAWPTLPVAQLVDAAVLSCEVGICKPDPKVYHLIADRLGVTPADCLFVGDGGSRELAGAAAVGMHPVQLVAPDWADDAAYHRHTGWPGPVISSLTEVLAMVRARQQSE